MIEFIADPAKTAVQFGSEAITIHVPPELLQYLPTWSLKYTGKKLQIRIKRYFPRRSTGWLSQNHHLNGHIQQICAETGNDFDVVKWEIKKLAIKRGYPFATARDGTVIPRSEARSDTAQCAMLIEEAHVLAGDLGIILREEI